jgi:nicotinate (nicotinamide) nucleotide adenylyltransferase
MSDFLYGWQKKYDRIAVLAGVFDPVHIGHLSAAKQAMNYARKVLIAPEKVPMHKHGRTSFEHRKAMIEIATGDDPDISVVSYPEDQQYIEPFFTWLRDQYPAEGYVWIVGSDVVSLIESWPGAEKLKDLGVVEIRYFERKGHGEVLVLKRNIAGIPVHRAIRKNSYRQKDTHQIINSTMIRKDLLQLKQQLPDGVFDYIKNHKLYDL